MKRALPILPLAALAGCGGFQSALGGEGIEGRNFVWLFALFLIVCAVMYVLIMGGLAGALWRSRRAQEVESPASDSSSERRTNRLLVGWIALIVVGLSGLTVASFFVDRANAIAGAQPKIRIQVTGNQWWWDVEYKGANAAANFRTANELRLPVGVPVQIALRSNDVIHSFWIPNLAGKQDLIPGRQTDIQLTARKTGLYRGQCAEFCGVQHAHMALDVTVTDAADFDRWVKAQQRVAFAPATPEELAGYHMFTTQACASCHAVAGTPANATMGPDLTHVASRRSIAAGTLPMSADNLARWISDPQAVKPGTNMPKVELDPGQLRAMAAYMRRLQ